VNGVSVQERVRSQAVIAGLTLSPVEVSRLELYFRLLSHWNRRINLTALQLEPVSDEAIQRLLVEPLAAARFVEDSPFDWFDLGSGGGSPAFPLKIVRPRVKLRLVEARSRKAAFLREVARELEFPEVDVINERIEALALRPEFVKAADLITVRGVRMDSATVMAARQLLRDEGQLLLFSKSGPRSDLQLSGLVKVLDAEPYLDSQLIVFKKGRAERT
jgi:16S rRNA (guanine527-N7)-methyltransferase